MMSLARQCLFSREVLVAICAVFVLADTLPVWGQSLQSAPTPSASFAVVSIKPNHPGTGLSEIGYTPDGFTAEGATVKFLIEYAYYVKGFQIAGGPEWIDSEEYNIQAKMDDSTFEALKKLPRDQMLEKQNTMLRSLLAERFKLKITESTEDLLIYDLVLAGTGPHLTQWAGESSSRSDLRELDGTAVTISGTAVTISDLADMVSGELGHEVVDRTGLEGKYDFSLNFKPEGPAPVPDHPVDSDSGVDAPPPDTSGPSIFTALQEQVGLKLEPQKGPVKILVIDSIEKPTEIDPSPEEKRDNDE